MLESGPSDGLRESVFSLLEERRAHLLEVQAQNKVLVERIKEATAAQLEAENTAEEATAWMSEHALNLKDSAIKQLRGVMGRLAKGIIYVVYIAWRENMTIAKQEAEHARMLAERAGSMQGAALRQLKSLMARRLKGDIYVIYLTWHDNMAAQKQADDRARQAAVKAAQMQSAALKQLKIIFGRLVKGEMYVMYATWQQNMEDYKQAEESARLAAQIAERMHSTALKQLSGIMLRIMKGEIYHHFSSWKSNQRAYKKSLARVSS